MHCYNNDILPHKAACVLIPRMATCPKETLCSTQSHTLAALSWSTVLPRSLSFPSVCPEPLSALPYLSWTDIFVTGFREKRSPRQVIQWQPIVCTHWSSKASVILLSSQSHIQNPPLTEQPSYTVPDPLVFPNSILCMFDSWFAVEGEKMTGRRATPEVKALSHRKPPSWLWILE